jgi:hypothetical protein
MSKVPILFLLVSIFFNNLIEFSGFRHPPVSDEVVELVTYAVSMFASEVLSRATQSSEVHGHEQVDVEDLERIIVQVLADFP